MVYESRRPEAKKLAPTAAVIQTQELHYKLPRGTQKVEAMFRKALLRNEKMNVSLLLQGYEAKRRLSQLFQSEGLGQANHPSTASVTRDSIPAVQTDIEQNSKPFREICREHGLVRSRTPTALPTRQWGQMKRDLTVSGFVFMLVLVGAILAANTERPVFWLLIGPAPVAVLHSIRTFLRPGPSQQKDLPESYEPDR